MVLDEILKNKREEVERSKQAVPLARLQEQLRAASPVRPFAESLKRPGTVRIIAELKKASPSAGLIRPDFEPAAIARSYERNGAAALSVLTDRKFFQGELEHLGIARKATGLPALRKDFVIDAYQVFEARSAGADAVLLIVRVLDPRELRELLPLARQLGMDALVEAHNEAEVDAAVSVGAAVIGINNRDLDTLQVSLETTGRLRSRIPAGPVVVSESGIKTRDDVSRLREWGVDAALVGESLMRTRDPGRQLRELAGV